MNKLIKSLTTLTLGAFVFASAALAFPNSKASNLDSENWQPPQPLEIIAPQISDAQDGRIVRVKLTIDNEGNASDVTVPFAHDPELKRNIVKAVEQWKFEPAMRDGKAVETRVVMPLELKVDYNS